MNNVVLALRGGFLIRILLVSELVQPVYQNLCMAFFRLPPHFSAPLIQQISQSRLGSDIFSPRISFAASRKLLL